jgi:hypothetical protein
MVISVKLFQLSYFRSPYRVNITAPKEGGIIEMGIIY